MRFFLLLNTKEDILKNVGNQTVAGPNWPFANTHPPLVTVAISDTVAHNRLIRLHAAPQRSAAAWQKQCILVITFVRLWLALQSPYGAFPLQRQICAQCRWQGYNATALGCVKFMAEHASKNNVYTLFAFHLLFTAIGCRPAFFARYLHKVEERPTFLMLSAALNAFSVPLSIP